MSGLTWSAASVSGTEAEAMSGGLAIAGCEGAGSTSGLFGGVRIANLLSGTFPVYARLPALAALHQFGIKNRSNHRPFIL